MEQTLYKRVITEQEVYPNAQQAAIDHLLMAHSHLFEEFEGRDCDNLLTDIMLLIDKLKNQ